MLLTMQRSMPAQLWPVIVQMSYVVRSCLCSAIPPPPTTPAHAAQAWAPCIPDCRADRLLVPAFIAG